MQLNASYKHWVVWSAWLYEGLILNATQPNIYKGNLAEEGQFEQIILVVINAVIGLNQCSLGFFFWKLSTYKVLKISGWYKVRYTVGKRFFSLRLSKRILRNGKKMQWPRTMVSKSGPVQKVTGIESTFIEWAGKMNTYYNTLTIMFPRPNGTEPGSEYFNWNGAPGGIVVWVFFWGGCQ